MAIHKHDVKTPRPRRRLSLADLTAREHARVTKLERELKKIRNRLARARLRYSTFLRMGSDELRRQADSQLLARKDGTTDGR